MSLFQLADIDAIPNVIDGWIREESYLKDNLITSGAVRVDAELNAKVAGGGNTFTINGWQPLADDADSVATDGTTEITPTKVTTSAQVAVRAVRTKAWQESALAAIIAGGDPMGEVRTQLAKYWRIRRQHYFINAWTGVFADNVANDSNDMSLDRTGTYTLGTTTFSATNFIDALLTAGDSMSDLRLIMCHSVVAARMEKENLSDFYRDSDGQRVGEYRGALVLVNDFMPVSTNNYYTWVFGEGATGIGEAPFPDQPIELYRLPLQGTGAGINALISRQQWSMHPYGFSFGGVSTGGGPANSGTGGNDLNEAASWNRVAISRKQIRAAQLITTEA